jgi:hypothetical protein
MGSSQQQQKHEATNNCNAKESEYHDHGPHHHQHVLQNLVAALSFESFRKRKHHHHQHDHPVVVNTSKSGDTTNSSTSTAVVIPKELVIGQLAPNGTVQELERVFPADATDNDRFQVYYARKSCVLVMNFDLPAGFLQRLAADSKTKDDTKDTKWATPTLPPAKDIETTDTSIKNSATRHYPWNKPQPWAGALGPLAPPSQLPLRFLRAGKNDPNEGLERYQETLQWRHDRGVDSLLRAPNIHFDTIKQHYPHYFHGHGLLGEPCFYERPPKTDLDALRHDGVSLEDLQRHFFVATEFQWQYLCDDDLKRSIYVIDLDGLHLGDFVGDTAQFVKQTVTLSAQHYPERAGRVFVINVPSWFQLVFKVVRPLLDESTLKSIYVLRGQDEILENLSMYIAPDQIPADFGGAGKRLGASDEENEFRDLMTHNNAIGRGEKPCLGRYGNLPCKWCSWTLPRSY